MYKDRYSSTSESERIGEQILEIQKEIIEVEASLTDYSRSIRATKRTLFLSSAVFVLIVGTLIVAALLPLSAMLYGVLWTLLALSTISLIVVVAYVMDGDVGLGAKSSAVDKHSAQKAKLRADIDHLYPKLLRAQDDEDKQKEGKI